MSSFTCEHCGKQIIDTPDGYITGCNHYAPELAYSKQYDAYYVIKTGRWTEKKCSDNDCEFCKDRPETNDKGDNDDKNI